MPLSPLPPSPPPTIVDKFLHIVGVSSPAPSGTVETHILRARNFQNSSKRPPPAASPAAYDPTHPIYTTVTSSAFPPLLPNPSRMRPPIYSMPADQPLHISALIAANWLATRFPARASADGYNSFIAARQREIINGTFPAPYWSQADHIGKNATCCIPVSRPDPSAPDPVWSRPDRLHTIPTYIQDGPLYPHPGLGYGLPTPTPGFEGACIGNYFTDTYHAAQLDDFQLPRPINITEYVPLFAHISGRIIVNAELRPTKIQMSLKHDAVLLGDGVSDTTLTAPLDAVGRFYEWHHPMPPDAPPGYTGERTFEFIADANIKLQAAPDNNGECARVRIRHSTPPARGKYFADSHYIRTDYDATTSVYLANQEKQDPGLPPQIVPFPDLPYGAIKRWYIPAPGATHRIIQGHYVLIVGVMTLVWEGWENGDPPP